MVELILTPSFPRATGAEATDDRDGNLNQKVSMLHLPSRVTTAWPTREEEPFFIVYRVSDMAGNEAAMIARQIHVVCPAGEQLCPSGDGEADQKPVCSFDPKFCKVAHISRLPQLNADSTAGVADSPPKIELVGPAEVTITAGDTYNRCAATAPLSLACERGAVAHDAVDGDLTSTIEVRSVPPRLDAMAFAQLPSSGEWHPGGTPDKPASLF